MYSKSEWERRRTNFASALFGDLGLRDGGGVRGRWRMAPVSGVKGARFGEVAERRGGGRSMGLGGGEAWHTAPRAAAKMTLAAAAEVRNLNIFCIPCCTTVVYCLQNCSPYSNKSVEPLTKILRSNKDLIGSDRILRFLPDPDMPQGYNQALMMREREAYMLVFVPSIDLVETHCWMLEGAQ